jgi:hypothetical protein
MKAHLQNFDDLLLEKMNESATSEIVSGDEFFEALS